MVWSSSKTSRFHCRLKQMEVKCQIIDQTLPHEINSYRSWFCCKPNYRDHQSLVNRRNLKSAYNLRCISTNLYVYTIVFQVWSLGKIQKWIRCMIMTFRGMIASIGSQFFNVTTCTHPKTKNGPVIHLAEWRHYLFYIIFIFDLYLSIYKFSITFSMLLKHY